MTSLRAALGIPVVARDTAEQLGKATGVVVDPQEARIVSVHVGGSKGSARFVPWQDIASFGDDAVMVDSGDAPRAGSGPLEEKAASGHGDLLDKRVLTETGDELGPLQDVEFDPSDGRLEGLTLEGERVAADRLLGVGAYAVVVRAPDADNG